MVTQDQPEQHEPKRHVAPPKRAYGESRFKRKTIDAAERAYLIKMLSFSLPGGAIGALAGGFIGIGALPGFLVGFLSVFLLVRLLVTGSGRVAGTIYHPSGKSTPHKREYSYAQSLAARGEFEKAITAYELCVADYPEDPEPYLHIARLYRDELERYDDAVAWFKRTRTHAQMEPGHELLATQEIIEIYTQRLREPRKAIPELARLCEQFPGTPAAQSAQLELRELRGMLAREKEGLESLTAQFRRKLRDAPLPDTSGEAAKDTEAQPIRDALRETGGDRRRAAKQLGTSVEALTERMRDLGIAADSP